MRSKSQREADLLLVEDWMLEGMYAHQIGERLAAMRPYALSTNSVLDDMSTIRERWRQGGDYEAKRAQHVAQLDKLAVEAWEAWKRSQRPLRTFETESGSRMVAGVGDIKRERLQDGYGDPRFLNVIKDVLGDKAKLEGLNAPVVTHNVNETLQVVVNEIPAEELAALRASLAGRSLPALPAG